MTERRIGFLCGLGTAAAAAIWIWAALTVPQDQIAPPAVGFLFTIGLVFIGMCGICAAIYATCGWDQSPADKMKQVDDRPH